jgi:hypothetical protein
MNEVKILVGELNLLDEECSTEFPHNQANPVASESKLTKLPE